MSALITLATGVLFQLSFVDALGLSLVGSSLTYGQQPSCVDEVTWLLTSPSFAICYLFFGVTLVAIILGSCCASKRNSRHGGAEE